MKTKHTSGPWEIKPEEAHRSYIRIRGTILSQRYKIANVNVTTCEDVGASTATAEINESRANARLIAAAPELYAMLKNMLAVNPSTLPSGLMFGTLQQKSYSLIAQIEND